MDDPMRNRIFELRPIYVVRDYVADDSGGTYDLHERSFLKKEDALAYLRNIEEEVRAR